MIGNVMKALGMAGKVLPVVKKGIKAFKIMRKFKKGKRKSVKMAAVNAQGAIQPKGIHPKRNIAKTLRNAKSAAKTTGSIYFRIGNLMWNRR